MMLTVHLTRVGVGLWGWWGCGVVCGKGYKSKKDIPLIM
jgi:hypothetical protein